MRKFIWLVVFGLMLTMAGKIFAGKIFTARLNYRVMLQDNPTEVQKFAAAELKKFLNEAYSEQIKLNGEPADLTFMIGFPAEAMLAGFTDIPSLKDRFGIFRRGTILLFYGDDRPDLDPVKTYKYRAGTLAAVHYFINRYLKVKFYFPGKAGYALTKNLPLDFKGSFDIPKPTFEVRGTALRNKSFNAEESNIFFRRSLGNIPYWSKYDLYYIYWKNWKKRFAKTHPEYFSLHNGKRISEIYPRHVPCFSNPEVLKQTAADIIGAINRNPEIKTVRVFCDAPISLCSCKLCLAAAERPYCGGDTANGEAVYAYQQKIMKLVHEAHPNIHFLTQTKGASYSKPPKLIKLGDDFTLKILTRRELPVYDPSNDVDLARDWQQTGVKVLLKSYPRYPEFKNYPIIKPHLDQQHFKAFAGIVRGADDSDARRYVPYAFTALGQYLQLKMLFDINIDLDREIADFCAFAYPGAETEMIAFYTEMERLFADGRSVNDDMFMYTYYPGKLKLAMQLLDQASRKVDRKSKYFKPLLAEFRKFYQKAQQVKKNIDIIRDAAPLKTIAIPRIDAKQDFKLLSPDMWHGAKSEKLFPAKSYDKFQPSKIYLGCTEQNLYVGLVATESHSDLLKQRCKVDKQGSIWGDDCFEVMLVPDKNKLVYYQIIVNSLGIYRVLRCQTGKKSLPDNDFKVKSSAKIGKGKWTAVLEIPLAQFNAADFGKTWKFNIFRSRRLSRGKGTDQQASGLRLLGGSYHDLTSYDHITWPKGLIPEKSLWNRLKFW
jgi:Domain of unknown function (DUF4838)